MTNSGDTEDSIRTKKPRFVGDYEVLEMLGRGGMGIVFKARHTKLDRIVALKMLTVAIDDSIRQRFQLEAKATAKTQHPHLINIYEVGEYDEQPFLVLEYLAGGSLEEKIDHESWTPEKAARLIEQLARALYEFHCADLVHRDLKPANILFTTDGQPKISDFGLAKSLASSLVQTRTGELLGTPNYMAPEQASGAGENIGPCTDIFALGAILYELLAGQPPFRGSEIFETLNRVLYHEPPPLRGKGFLVPRDLEAICLKCLEKEPEARYASALDLADDLARFRRGEPVAARNISPTAQAIRWVRRNPLPMMVAIGLCIGFVLSTLSAVIAYQRADDLAEKNKQIAEQQAALQLQSESLQRQNIELEQQGQTLRDEKLRAEDAHGASALQLAQQLWLSGRQQAQAGRIDEGLFRFLAALRTTPPKEADFRRVLLLELAAWHERLPQLLWVVEQSGQAPRFLGPNSTKLGLARRDGYVVLETHSGKVAHGPFAWEGTTLQDWSSDGEHLVVTFNQPQAGKWLGEVRRVADNQPILPQIQSTEPKPFQVFFARGSDTLFTDTYALDTVQGWNIGKQTPLTNPLVLPPGRRIAVNPAWLALLPETGNTLQWIAASTGEVSANGPNPNELSALYSPDGRTIQLLTADRSHLFRTQQPSLPLEGTANSAQLAPDGRRYWIAQSDGHLMGFDLDSQLPVGSVPMTNGDFAISAEGSLLAISSGGLVRLFQIPDFPPLGSEPAQVRESRKRAGFSAPMYSPDGTKVHLVQQTTQLESYSAIRSTTEQVPLGEPLGVAAELSVFSPDNKLLAIAAQDQALAAATRFQVQLWDANAGKPTGHEWQFDSEVTALSFSPESQLLSVGTKNTLQVFDTTTGDNKHTVSEIKNARKTFFSNDSQRLLAVVRETNDKQGGYLVWDLDAQKALAEFVPAQPLELLLEVRQTEHDQVLTFEVLEPSGIRIRYWDLSTGQESTQVWNWPENRAVQLVAGGNYIIQTTADAALECWDVKRQQRVARRESAGHLVSSLSISDDGNFFAVVHQDDTVQVYDTVTCCPLGPPFAARTQILASKITSNPSQLRVTTADGRTQSWRLWQPIANDDDRILQWLEVSAGRHEAGAALSFSEFQTRIEALSAYKWSQLSWQTQTAGNQLDLDRHRRQMIDALQCDQPNAAAFHARWIQAAQPERWQAAARLAMTYQQLGRMAAAKNAYATAFDLSDAETLATWCVHQAALAKLEQDFTQALSFLTKAIQLQPENSGLYVQRAFVHKAVGAYAEQEADLERAMRLAPERVGLSLFYAEAAAQQGNWEQATSRLQSALAKHPQVLKLRHALCIAALRAEKKEIYQQLCRQTVEQLAETDSTEARLQMLKLLLVHENEFLPPKTELLSMLQELEFQSVRGSKSLKTIALFRCGEFKNCVETLRQQIQASSQASRPAEWVFLAMAYTQLGNQTEATQWWRRAMQLHQTRSAGSFWQRAEYELYNQEAEKLLGVPSKKPAS